VSTSRKSHDQAPPGPTGVVDARRRFHLSHAHVQMAREIGLTRRSSARSPTTTRSPGRRRSPSSSRTSTRSGSTARGPRSCGRSRSSSAGATWNGPRKKLLKQDGGLERAV